MQKVLLVEDSPEIQILVRGTIGKQCDLTIVTSVSEAMNTLQNSTVAYDLFLIDIILPDGDGYHICSYLRNSDKTFGAPIVFLTNKAETEDKVLGFALGADDYIVKPFSPLELRARVDAKLRRVRDLKRAENQIWKGNIKLNLPFQKAFLISGEKEQDLELTAKEFNLLFYFIKHEGHVLSRGQLLDNVWGNSVNVVDRTIDTHVCILRKKLTLSSIKLESVFGQGYRLIIR